MVGTIPENSQIRDFDLKGRPTIELDKENQAIKAAHGIFDEILDNRI